ncbi:formate dehydrogenase subunit alpha [Sorangium sp. So ce854]|uniref:formate dehydrogenase subunit alpha n=1 Tax=Sorangium sp. So ce854 TaxID=3133322 RepID=UPI003F631B39
MGDARIDGRPVEARGGETILTAARCAGVAVPTLCFVPGLLPEGGCRVCLVELGDGRLAAACQMPVASGMSVLTDTPRLRSLRRGVLSLILSEHEPGRFRPDPCGNEVERLMAHLEMASSDFGHFGASAAVDASHPYMRFDRSLCITCRRCLNACEQVQGQFVYGITGRGAHTGLIFGSTPRFSDSDCTACGACVDRCPTGAISDRDRRDGAPSGPLTESVCGYCGVGCRIRVAQAGGRVTRIDGVGEAAVNRGHLCAKGRYAHGYREHADRLTRPLRRDERGELAPIAWGEATAWLARRLAEIRDERGPDALGAITSSRSTNEACYLLQKLFRTAIGTNNIDCCARVCHSSTALALTMVTGTGAATASYADIERARCIVVAGANPTEAHPIVGARLKQAALRGARLVVIDPRRIELADYADAELMLRPGTNVLLFNALAKLLLASGRIDGDYLCDRTDGLEALVELTDALDLDQAAATCGVTPAALSRAAELIGAGPCLFVHGLGLSELTQGTASVVTLCNLGLLTGSIGRPGAGMLPLRGQNNVQGNADMGAAPDRVTGYQRLDDPAVRQRLAAIWGRPPPLSRGLTIPEMMDAALAGRLRGLWVQGEDIAQSESNQRRVIEALSRMELVVVQDLFLCETARYAHLVLPAAGALEQDGTFTNAERRIQRVRAAARPPGQGRPDADVIADVARAMGQQWSYADPAAIMDEIARVAPAPFGGVAYDRLDGDGLQWPCPSRDHPGTATLHEAAFLRGPAQLVAVEYQADPERADATYPLLLITGRVLQHYNVGTMTRRTPSIALLGTDLLEIHPDDAARSGIAEGALVAISSRWGGTTAPAHLSARVAPGMVFLSFHDPASHANLLVGPHTDPMSKCPSYKVTAVRVEPALAR